MFRSNSIRPIVLGLTKKDNKILVGQGYDKVKNKTFYRALGGGIEFTETSKDAIIREFKEEINADITAYSKQYERQLFIVYDLGCIQNEEEFRRDIESMGNIKVLIIKH